MISFQTPWSPLLHRLTNTDVCSFVHRDPLPRRTTQSLSVGKSSSVPPSSLTVAAVASLPRPHQPIPSCCCPHPRTQICPRRCTVPSPDFLNTVATDPCFTVVLTNAARSPSHCLHRGLYSMACLCPCSSAIAQSP
ncbi:hypothetical protein M0R45_026093 [Rubus argutus]|uniref:Uncharacterized protein n=1 Tax=Rubus argutus TaxID=59490 RepID=A0AAW1WZX2_RUBAR